MAKKKVNSFKDEKGALWVACSECSKGGNGSDTDKCSSGWTIKKFNGLGCFCGTLIKGIEVQNG